MFTSINSAASVAACFDVAINIANGSPRWRISDPLSSGRGLSTVTPPSSRTGPPVHIILVIPSLVASAAVRIATTPGASFASLQSKYFNMPTATGLRRKTA